MTRTLYNRLYYIMVRNESEQKINFLCRSTFILFWGLYTEPSICASYQISVHLATRFQRRIFFRNQPIRNKNCLWQPCLLTNRDEMSNLYREPSIDASYQVSVHFAKRFQRRRFLEIDNQKQEWPQTACL